MVFGYRPPLAFGHGRPGEGLTSACAAQVDLDRAYSLKAVCGQHIAVDVTVTIVIPYSSLTRNLTLSRYLTQEEPAGD